MTSFTDELIWMFTTLIAKYTNNIFQDVSELKLNTNY